MGTWGTGISSSDAFADVYSEFFSLYNDGEEVDDITKTVIARNQEMLSIPEEANDFWFALAKAQWECKHLQPKIFEKVKALIESEGDLKIWAQLEATSSDIEKRRKALGKFLLQLQSERPKVKARKKKIIRAPIFGKGDCLTYRLFNGNYGGALVLEAEYGTELAVNLMAVTRINQPEVPNIRDFEKGELLIKNFGNWTDQPEIIWICNYKPKDVQGFVKVIGRIEIAKDFLEERHKYPYTSGWKMTLLDMIELQFESEVTKPGPKRKVKMTKFIKNRFWGHLF